jgi:hypothetical protein
MGKYIWNFVLLEGVIPFSYIPKAYRSFIASEFGGLEIKKPNKIVGFYCKWITAIPP